MVHESLCGRFRMIALRAHFSPPQVCEMNGTRTDCGEKCLRKLRDEHFSDAKFSFLREGTSPEQPSFSSVFLRTTCPRARPRQK